MIRWLIRRKLNAVEREIGVPVDYLRHMVDVSLRAFLRFARVFSLAAYRRKLPVSERYVAMIVATQDEDCGTCVQIAVNLARNEGVSRDILNACLQGDVMALPEGCALVYRFVRAVLSQSPEAPELRTDIRAHFGEEALIELALAVASTRLFPMTKRMMGYAVSCTQVTIRVD